MVALVPEANGGLGNELVPSGEDGTVWSTPCAPGYEGFFCTPCQSGYYKTEFSNVACKKCENKPPNVYNAYYQSLAAADPMCPYFCEEGVDQSYINNPKCMTSYQIFVDNIGGE